MPKLNPFVQSVVAQLNHVAPVSARAMFGGYGLYSEEVMFGLIAYDVLYFKVDSVNQQAYLDAESSPFIYQRHDKAIQMSYYQLPDQVFKDLEQLDSWYEAAHAAGVRAKQGKKKKRQVN